MPFRQKADKCHLLIFSVCGCLSARDGPAAAAVPRALLVMTVAICKSAAKGFHFIPPAIFSTSF